MITHDSVSGGVPLVRDGSAADVYVDEDDADVVRIAAEDFAEDVARVTDERPALAGSLGELTGTAVVAGTLGSSEGVDVCVERCGLDGDAERLSGGRESFLVRTVADPLSGVDSAVLVVGSDRRGTAFGIYELSKRIGVSPWYWWADVPPDRRETLVVEPGAYRYGPPSVAYRGVFLNDEDFGLRPWASETFAPEDAADRPGVGPRTYEKLFELLLRLKANTVWPAMHPGTKAFYRYPEHAELADRYAVIVGTSHCEPMHRNNVDEWEDAVGEWNYATNRDRVLAYWRERVESVAGFENVFTLGMRGIHDSGMPGGETRAETRTLLQGVLDDQRRLLDAAHERPVEEVPQVFCPYKEVLDLYREGLDVPEDVCLLWPDDSHGYLRGLPTEADRERSGGSGIYYHLSYWGRPHDYLWLSSVPLGVVSTEMRRAYEAGARECWVVNVGDLKPTEKETEFFLDLAWDVDLGGRRSPSEWLVDWATREFGEVHADEIADLLSEYYRLCLARKPEHMGWSTVYPDTPTGDPAFSFVHGGDEARRRLDAFVGLVDRAETAFESLPRGRRPAFYQLVLYPLRCAAAMSEKFLHAARSRRYAEQGRASANRYADAALDAHDRIRVETTRYNETLLGGKWDRMQSASPRDLRVFDPPDVARLNPAGPGELGVAVEGRREPLEPDGEVPSLPAFRAGVGRRRFVDVFNYGAAPFEWTATADAEWVEVSERSGTVEDERRLWVGVDWDELAEARASSTVTVAGAGAEYAVRVEAVASADETSRAEGADFLEVDGSVGIEAERYSRKVDGAPERWVPGDVPGRLAGGTMRVAPARFESHDPDADDAPRLEYDVELTTAGAATVKVQCLPAQAAGDGRNLRYAVALGDGPRRAVSVDPDGDEHDPEWQKNVLRGAAVTTTTHDVESAGVRTLRLWALDPGLVVDRIAVYADGERETYLGPQGTAVRKSK
ncbi:glycosyl hydrolase 115 family protein [Halogeometricum sp. S1BR25-6]|uniref:Glycosyl hydrolase 115 family protein n=1 Tax=Halogeometricum salsisoli TaxID=2950536 RepID=A0ABU2GK35_9EURY|nr:glycosyl hydrolase 115 family protein [Halogeometricum sp. S1BR25-6]MDS0300649.1 glycosyl hydrolase 115 family protein [Halogeometricum sp. S1BR25-6]